MRTKNSKVKITLEIPFDKPDCNGVIYTEEAIKRAFSNLHTSLPIVYADTGTEQKCIGVTNKDNYVVDWDFEKRVYTLTINGIIFHAGAEIIVNAMEDGKITDFEIRSIGLSI